MSRAAVRYAKAILELATSNNNDAAVNEDMKTIAQVVKGNKELKDFLANTTIKGNVKTNVVQEIFGATQKETSGLFQLLLQNKRFEILENVAQNFSKLFDTAKGIETAVVTTAVPLTQDLKSIVMAKVKEFSSATNITIQNTVDASIIGGFILRVGDKQYNASVANKLQQLKREFTN